MGWVWGTVLHRLRLIHHDGEYSVLVKNGADADPKEETEQGYNGHDEVEEEFRHRDHLGALRPG